MASDDLSGVTAGSENPSVVLDKLNQVIDRLTPTAQGTSEAQAELAHQMQQLGTVNQAQAEAVLENTRAVVDNTVYRASSGVANAVSGVAGVASKLFGSGLGLSPLISGLIGLFGGSEPEPAPLTPYSAPAPVNVDAIISGTGGSRPVGAVEPGLAMGTLAESLGSRAANSPDACRVVSSQASAGTIPSPETRNTGATVYPSVTVQVQAMDSRSFLDHSNEIARAVRQAILNSHSLTDVMGEL